MGEKNKAFVENEQSQSDALYSFSEALYSGINTMGNTKYSKENNEQQNVNDYKVTVTSTSTATANTSWKQQKTKFVRCPECGKWRKGKCEQCEEKYNTAGIIGGNNV